MDFNADDAEAMRQMWRDTHGLEAAPQPTAEHGLERLGSQLVNAPKRAVMAMGETIQGVGDFLSGKPQEQRDFERQTREDVGRNFMYRTRDVGPGNGALDTTTDVLAGGILPELPSLMIPGGIATKGARLLGATARLAPVVGDVAAGALSGLRDSGKEAGLQAAEFGGMGLVGAALPRALRPLFRRGIEGAAGATIGLVGQKLRGHDAFSQQSLIQAGAMGLMPAAMEATGGVRRLFRRGQEVAPTNAGVDLSQGIPSTWKLKRRVERPDGGYDHVFDTPEGEQIIPHSEQFGGDLENRIVPREADPSMEGRTVGNPYGPETAPRPRRALPESAEPRPPDDSIIEGEFTVEPPKQLMGRRLFLNGPPPYGQGGGDRRFRMQGEPYEPPAGPIPMGRSEPRRLLNRAEPPPSAGAEPHDIVPAIRVGGETVTGNAGETHQDVLRRFVRDNPDRAVDALTTFDTKANPNFFVGPRGEPISRAQLHGRFGVTDSQGLRDLQARPSGLRPLSREGGSIDPALLGGIAGATVGALSDPEHRERNAILGALGGGVLGAAGRRILRRLPAAEEAARRQVTGIGGKSLQGGAVRMGEKLFKRGRSASLDVLGEQARGTVDTLAKDVRSVLDAAVPKIKGLSPTQKSALAIYMGSDRQAGAKAILTAAALPKEIMDFVDVATTKKAELQNIVADAQGDPERAKLIRDTLGTYVTEPYRAFVNPKQWQKTGVPRPLFDKIVTENMSDPRFAGMSREQVGADTEAYFRDEVMNFGGDFSRMANEGKSRMSQSLFTKRKLLRPSVQEALGKIHDPIEREVLTMAKLVKSATTAKVVTETLRTADDAGNPLAMSSSDWNTAIQSAKASGDTTKASFLEGYEQVPDTLPGLGAISSQNGTRMMAQRQVMDMLQAGTPHGNVDWEKGVLGTLGKLNRIPKASFTLYNPGTHIHNVMQAPLQAAAAGMAPWSFVNNIRRLHADPKKLLWARQDGILDAHLGAGEFRRAADDYEKVLNPGKLGFARKIHDAVKNLYGKPDQWVRGASYVKFLDEAEKLGMKPEQARKYSVEMTNRYTQNYSNVAPAVAIARNVPFVNPFISYTAEMARIIKNLAEDVVSDPMKAKYGVSRRLQSGIALATLFGLGAGAKALIEKGMMSDDEKKKIDELIPLLPDYMKGRTQAGVGYDQKRGTGSLLNLNPWLPAEDFVQTAKNILSGEWGAVAQTNPVVGLNRTPVLNMAVEAITGKDAVTGAPSEGPISMLRKNTLPGWLPGGYAAQRLSQGFSRNAEGELGVTDDRGRRETPTTALLGLAGVSVSQQNTRRLFQRKGREQTEQDRAAKQTLNHILRSDADATAKDEAAHAYQETRRRIFQR